MSENKPIWKFCDYCEKELPEGRSFRCSECHKKSMDLADIINGEMSNMFFVFQKLQCSFVTSKGWYYVNRKEFQLKRIDRMITKLKQFRKLIEKFGISNVFVCECGTQMRYHPEIKWKYCPKCFKWKNPNYGTYKSSWRGKTPEQVLKEFER